MPVTKLAAAATVPLALVTGCGAAAPHGSTTRHGNALAAAPTLVPLGAPITTAARGSMTLTKAVCGQRQVRYAALEDSKGTASKVLHAAAGHQICVLIATFTDTASTPLSPAPFANLVTANGQAYPEDTNLSAMMSVYSAEHPSTSKFTHAIQPGASMEFRAYFQIPTSTKASSIAWPATSVTQPQSFVLG